MTPARMPARGASAVSPGQGDFRPRLRTRGAGALAQGAALRRAQGVSSLPFEPPHRQGRRRRHPRPASGPRRETESNEGEIEAVPSLIRFDPDINLFRGALIDLNGGADCYAAHVESLRGEGETSLKVFRDMCLEGGVEPRRQFPGRFNLRVPPGFTATWWLHRDREQPRNEVQEPGV